MSERLTKSSKVISWIFQFVAAFILVQASYGKFIGSEMSVYVFRTIGMGDTGRILIGIIEGLAVVMLLTPNLPHLGALLGFATMIGALMAHISILGLDVLGDGGMMVGMMVTVIISTLIVMGIHRRSLPLIGYTFD